MDEAPLDISLDEAVAKLPLAQNSAAAASAAAPRPALFTADECLGEGSADAILSTWPELGRHFQRAGRLTRVGWLVKILHVMDQLHLPKAARGETPRTARAPAPPRTRERGLAGAGVAAAPSAAVTRASAAETGSRARAAPERSLSAELYGDVVTMQVRAVTVSLTHSTGQGPIAADLTAGFAALAQPPVGQSFDSAADCCDVLATVACKAVSRAQSDEVAKRVRLVLHAAIGHALLTEGGTIDEVPADVDLARTTATVAELARSRLLGHDATRQDLPASPAHSVRPPEPAREALAAHSPFALTPQRGLGSEMDPWPAARAEGGIWREIASPARPPRTTGELKSCLADAGTLAYLTGLLHVPSPKMAALVAVATGVGITSVPESVVTTLLETSPLADSTCVLRAAVEAAARAETPPSPSPVGGFRTAVEDQLHAVAAAWVAAGAPPPIKRVQDLFVAALATLAAQRTKTKHLLAQEIQEHPWSVTVEALEYLWASDSEAALRAAVTAVAASAFDWRTAGIPVGPAAFAVVLAATAVALVDPADGEGAELRLLLDEALPDAELMPRPALRGSGPRVHDRVLRYADRREARRARPTAERRGRAAPRQAAVAAWAAAPSAPATKATSAQPRRQKKPSSSLTGQFTALLGMSPSDFMSSLWRRTGASGRPPMLIPALAEGKMAHVLKGGLTANALAEAIAGALGLGDDPPGSPADTWALLRQRLGLGFPEA